MSAISSSRDYVLRTNKDRFDSNIKIRRSEEKEIKKNNDLIDYLFSDRLKALNILVRLRIIIIFV